MREWSDSFLEILSRRLCSKCPEMRRLVLRGLVVLSKDPVMVRRGEVAEAVLESWGWGMQSLGLGWPSGAVTAALSSAASLFSCPSPLGPVAARGAVLPEWGWWCNHS